MSVSLKLKVVRGENFLKSPLLETELEIYQAGETVKKSRNPRVLHTCAIERGFTFRPDARMLFKGYYFDPIHDLYAAIV